MVTDTCSICHEPIESADEIHWRHSRADKDEFCGTGDGSTAYPAHRSSMIY